MRYTLCLILFFSPVYLFAQFGNGKLVYGSGGFDIPQIIQASDLDGDGDIDVLIKESGNALFWVANDKTGNFSGKAELPGSKRNDITSLKTFDYDKDGDQDVVAAFADIHQIYLWKNNGNGTFASPVMIGSSWSDIHSLTIVDNDNDGNPDVLVSIEYDYSVWLKNDLSLNQWTSMPLTTVGDNTDYMDVLDMDGDGDLDYLTISDNSANIILNGKNISPYSIQNALFVKGVDLDRDGDMDVVAAANFYDNGIIWLENNGGSFTGHILENSSAQYEAITMFDFDNDGDEDIFASCGFGCGTSIYENLGAGNFKYAVLFGSGAVEEQSLLHADFNGDHIPDLVKNNGSTHTTAWYPNNATQFTGIKSDFESTGHCLTAPVLFRHAARGKDIQSWQWNFGDGTTSTQRNPSHQFASQGIFTVKLKVTNALGQSDELTKQVFIQATLPFKDKEYPLCDPQFTLTLDTAFTYRWYGSPEESAYWGDGNTMNFYTFSSQDLYIKRTEIATGCTSATFEKITAKYYGHPVPPNAIGAISYSGPATLTLQATGELTTDTVEWSTDAAGQNVIERGNSLTKYFTNTTTYFVRSRNAGGCTGTIIPVSGNVFSDEVRQPAFVWGSAGKSDRWTQGQSVVLDADGKPVIYGLWTGDRVIAGNDTLTATLSSSNFLMKYSETGQPLSALKLTTGEEFFDSYYQTVLFDQNNNIFLQAYVRMNRTIGDKLITVPEADKVYCVIAKLSPSGKMLWYHMFEASKVNIKLDALGDLHVSMAYQGKVQFDGGPVLVPPQYQSGYCLFKYSNDGALKYVVQTDKRAAYHEIAADDQGNTYWVASFEGAITVSGNVITDPYIGLVLVKYNPDGTLGWVKKASENMGWPALFDIETDQDGNVVILGSFSTYDSWKVGEVCGVAVGSGNGAFIAKVSPNGTTVWVKRLSSPNQMQVSDLDVSVDNSIYIVGAYANRLVFDGYRLTQEGGNSFSHARSFAAKFDSDGNTHWAKDTDQQLGELSCHTDAFGNLYIAGSFIDETTLGDIHLTSNATLPPPYANYNMVLAKIGFNFGADFHFNAACQGAEVHFKDASTPGDGNNLVSWHWDFGDGTTSTEQNPTHVFAEAGTYHISVAVNNQFGGTSSKIKTLIISSGTAPQVELRAAGDFCMNNSVTYQAKISGQGSSYSVQWFADDQLLPQYSNSNSISVVVAVEQEIKVQVRSLDNCPNVNRIAADSVQQFASSPPAPPAVQSSGNTLFVEGDYSGYNWYKNDSPLNEHTSTLNATVDGNYRVEVINEFGCNAFSASVPFTLTVTGVEDPDEQKVQLYPNPFTNEISIVTTLPIERIVIWDSQGRMVYSAIAPEEKLSTKDFTEGLYIVQLFSQGKITRRVMVKVR